MSREFTVYEGMNVIYSDTANVLNYEEVSGYVYGYAKAYSLESDMAISVVEDDHKTEEYYHGGDVLWEDWEWDNDDEEDEPEESVPMTKERVMQIASDMISRILEFEDEYFGMVMKDYDITLEELKELGFYGDDIVKAYNYEVD